jgi:hypothetical protein
VNVHDKKDGTTAQAGASATAPAAQTAATVPSLPGHPPLDLDMEELSGSLLVEEPPGRGVLMVTGPAAEPRSTSPLVPSSHSASPRTSVPPPQTSVPPPQTSVPPPQTSVPTARLPKPNPPPRQDLALRSHQPTPPPLALDAAATAHPLQSPNTGPTPRSLPHAEQPAPGARPPTGRLEPLADERQAMPPSRGSPLTTGSKWAQPVIAFVALVGVIGLVVVVRRHQEVGGASASSTATVSSTAPAAVAASSALAPATTIVPMCSVAGAPHVIAPNAIVAAGIEVRAFGNDIALGFASSEHQAMLVRLDPSSLSTVESTVVHSAGVVRRVTPIPGQKGRLGLAVDVDRKRDALRGRRTLPLDPPLQVGVADAHLAWAPLDRGVAGKLWPLDGDSAVEALRGARSESNLAMVAIAFRRAGAVWVGTAEGGAALAPKGDLSRIGGLGAMVGSPAITFNEGIVLVAWADRPSSDDPWRLLWVRFKAGDVPGAERTFTPPSGGKGEQVMSPGLAVVPGGRYLLVWTEGPASSHEVRALTLSEDGAAVGDPLNVSNPDANAGQGQAAVTASGTGVVAFLEASATGFQVVATPIACAP